MFDSLKLSFYTSLGIEVQRDAKSGEYNRAIIHNTSRGDVNVIDVDSSRGPGEYTKALWESI